MSFLGLFRLATVSFRCISVYGVVQSEVFFSLPAVQTTTRQSGKEF